MSWGSVIHGKLLLGLLAVINMILLLLPPRVIMIVFGMRTFVYFEHVLVLVLVM